MPRFAMTGIFVWEEGVIMTPVFVDTGGWIAMAVIRDQHHKQAASFYQELSKQKVPLPSSNHLWRPPPQIRVYRKSAFYMDYGIKQFRFIHLLPYFSSSPSQ
jgi:hypothetical protein